MFAVYGYLRIGANKSAEKGQIAVEYILLLAIGVSLAAIITSLVVSRSDDSPGFLISKWKAIITMIATDKIEN